MHKTPLGGEDLWDDQRAINYLPNFWEPKLGSQMLIDGEYTTIDHVEKDYPEQVSLKGDDSIHYVQDLEWFPEMSEVFDIFKNLGIKVFDDGVRYNRIFKSKPKTLIEAAQILVDLRVVSMIRPDTALGL